MPADYELRPVRADDYEALVALAVASADTGRIRVAPKYLRNPVEAWAALRPELEWVVAESDDGLIGGGQVVFGETVVEGKVLPRATLASLMVHPAHRRRGLAKAITRWRLERAGPDAVIVAAIQTGNEGSFANARTWATQIFGTAVIPVFRATRGRPAAHGLELREPRDDAEWDEAAAGLERFEDGWNLRTPRTGASLRERSARTLDGERLQHCVVAVERRRVVGGFELFENARLQTLVFEHLPLELRALNLLVRVLPRDGELRQSSISQIWFAPGRADVASALWAHARSLASEAGNAIGTTFDARSPLRALVPVRPWTPKAKSAIAVRSPVRLSEDRLVSPP
jgi:GNAT superfamily N-acetyltransferase